MNKMKNVYICSIILVSTLLFFSCGNNEASDSNPNVVSPINYTIFDETGRADKGGCGVMLQGFTWSSPSLTPYWYKNISSLKDEIKDTFEFVWFPPASDSTDPAGNGYLPRCLNILEQNESDKIPSYGTVEELKQAIKDIAPAKAIADVVINHRCGTISWGDFTEPSWDKDFYSICSDDEGFSSDSSGMKGARYKGALDTGEGYSAARDLDHTNLNVQNGIITWMNDILKDIGFLGWRYDYVKGYAGKFTGYYNAKTSPEFSVGEYFPTSSFSSSSPETWSDVIYDWVKSTCETVNETPSEPARAFDFVLKGFLNDVFGYYNELQETYTEKPNSHYEYLSNEFILNRRIPGYAVTFVDNHDTGSTQARWFIDPYDIGTAYAFILTHPGYPSVAWYHYFSPEDCPNDDASQYMGDKIVPGTTLTCKSFISHLIKLRKDAGISDLSLVETLKAENTGYVGKILGDKKTLIVAIGKDYDCPKGYSEEFSGTNFQIYSNSNLEN